MKSSWKKVCLGDIVSIKHGWAFPGVGITSQKSKNVLVTPGNFAIGGGFKYNDKKFFNEDYPEGYLLSPGDLIVTMTDLSKGTDTLGYSALVPNDGRNYLHNQRIGLVQLKNGEVDKLFIYWLMRTKLYQRFVANYASGTSVKHTSPSLIGKFCFMLPDITEQKKISSVLSALDDKIAINKAINKNLEATAQAIFKSWFVDFEPFGGVMPADWSLCTLGEFANICNRTFDPKKHTDILLEHYSIPAFDSNGLPVVELSNSIESNKFIVDRECCLISKLNPSKKRVWKPYCLSNFSVCSTEFIVYKAKCSENTNFLYSVIDSDNFSKFMCSHVTGTTGSRQRTQPTTTLNFIFALPSEDVLCKFDKIFGALYERSKYTMIENQRLAAIRDALLPKLMSGEIDVSQVKI